MDLFSKSLNKKDILNICKKLDISYISKQTKEELIRKLKNVEKKNN